MSNRTFLIGMAKAKLTKKGILTLPFAKLAHTYEDSDISDIHTEIPEFWLAEEQRYYNALEGCIDPEDISYLKKDFDNVTQYTSHRIKLTPSQINRITTVDRPTDLVVIAGGRSFAICEESYGPTYMKILTSLTKAYVGPRPDINF